MMLTSVSSISTTIESNSERAPENFIVDVAESNWDLVDTPPKFRATSAIWSQAVAEGGWYCRHQGAARGMKARPGVFVRNRAFSESAAARKRAVASRLLNPQSRPRPDRFDNATRNQMARQRAHRVQRRALLRRGGVRAPGGRQDRKRAGSPAEVRERGALR